MFATAFYLSLAVVIAVPIIVAPVLLLADACADSPADAGCPRRHLGARHRGAELDAGD